MGTAADFVPDATSGNTTSVKIDAPAEAVWEALHNIRVKDLRLTSALLAIRSVPATVTGRGSLRHRLGMSADVRALDAIKKRFIVLYEEPNRVLTLGIIGQFWKLRGGQDVALLDANNFVEFDDSGFVKSALDFVVEERGAGSRLTTHTCNRSTDETAGRLFKRYWRVIAPGSKLIRFTMLRAVRKSARDRTVE